MKSELFDVMAPTVTKAPFSEAEALGAAVWLWMQSKAHRDVPLHSISVFLLPFIKRGQFVIVTDHGKPIFYFSYAYFSEEAEHRYLNQPLILMQEADLNSGDRCWIIDLIAPFGHTSQMVKLLTSKLFPNSLMRSLYHRGDEKGMRILNFKGLAVLSEEAKHWFDNHPVSLPTEGSLPLDRTATSPSATTNI